MSGAGEYRIGVDVGGTFTDVVGIAADGAETLAKAPSTPHDQSEGVLAGLENLAAALGLPLAELLGPVILQARRSPHTDMVGAGASARLPRLDSNQQPFD